jgi:DNA-binding transcriptional ArsR family regulator
MYDRRSRNVKEPEANLIDRIRHDIQERLDQLLAEADKLRLALAALDPREQPAPSPPARPATRTRPPRTASRRARTAQGATKAAILRALADGGAMTAGDVAAATGLARGTVSTTLSRLANSGEVIKADRGYRRDDPGADTSAARAPADAASLAGG